MAINTGCCADLSRGLREGLTRYDLMPTEFLAAHIMCLETFDAGTFVGRVDLEGWARRMGMRDAKGLRTDKCEKVVKNLVDLGIADVNFAQGTYELRPCSEHWSRTRAFRCAARPGEAGAELPLSAERPLSEALSELSREKALEGAPEPQPDWRSLFSLWKEAFQAGPAALDEFFRKYPQAKAAIDSAEKSADAGSDVRRKNPPKGSANSAETVNPQSPQGFAADFGHPKNTSAEKSADAAIASSASVPQKAKLAKASAEKSAELAAKQTAARAWLELVDSRGDLSGPFGPQWTDLCERDPFYVLNRLRGAYEDHMRRVRQGEKGLQPVNKPLAWLSRKARDDGRMRVNG